MRIMTDLPQGYALKKEVHLSAKDTNSTSFMLCAGLLALSWWWRGYGALSELQRAGFLYYVTFALAMIAALFAVSWLHQLTHALLLRLFTGTSPLFARKRLQLFVGSSAYLCRRDAVLVLLLPMLIWTAVGAVFCVLTDGVWFWFSMTLPFVNLGNAADDVSYAFHTLRAPKNALIQYRGFAVEIYTGE